MFTRERAETEPLDAILETLKLHVVTPFRLSQEVFPHMVSVGRGAIVNISSISGHVGVPGIPQASYAASKMASERPHRRAGRAVGAPSRSA